MNLVLSKVGSWLSIFSELFPFFFLAVIVCMAVGLYAGANLAVHGGPLYSFISIVIMPLSLTFLALAGSSYMLSSIIPSQAQNGESDNEPS